MNDGMAVRTHRAKVFNWVDDVLFANGRQRFQVMDMNVPIGGTAVCSTEVETADGATAAVVSDALLAGNGITLEGTDFHSETGTFDERLISSHFFLKRPATTSDAKFF